MRATAGWAAGGALAVLVWAALPAAAQQQQQQAPAEDTAAAGAFATRLRDTEARLGRAIEQAQGGTGRTQAGAMPPGQQQLMDATQAAWQAAQGAVPESMRGNSGPYADADRTFRRVVETMRVGSTPPDAAVAAAREAHAALGRLREAAESQGTGAGAATPPAATSNPAPLQEPSRR